MQLILGSASPRRREILSNIHIPHTVRTADVDESISAPLSPRDTVVTLAERKLHAVLALLSEEEKQNSIVLCADTVVALDGTVYGKPADHADAVRMLSSMSGRAHSVFTGYALCYRGKTVSDAEETRVAFRALENREIESYIALEPPYDKAGAYGIQELAGLFVERIEGDYQNIVGLPVSAIAHVCKTAFGISFFDLIQ